MGSHKSSPAPGFTHLTPWSLEGLLPAPKAASCALPRGSYPSAEPGSLFSTQRSKSRDFLRLHLSPWPWTQGVHLRIHYLLVKQEGRTHSVRSCLCREPGGTTGSAGCAESLSHRAGLDTVTKEACEHHLRPTAEKPRASIGPRYPRASFHAGAQHPELHRSPTCRVREAHFHLLRPPAARATRGPAPCDRPNGGLGRGRGAQ